jgi:hypothetical protein
VIAGMKNETKQERIKRNAENLMRMGFCHLKETFGSVLLRGIGG